MFQLTKTHPRHPKYKPTNIDWIGDIPDGWEVRRIKTFSQVRRGASPRPIDDPVYFDENGKYSWVRIADVSASDRYLIEAPQKLSALGQSLSVEIEPGELFVSIAGTVGKPIISGIKCCIHDGFVYFKNLQYSKDLLYWVFTGGEAYKGLGKLGTQLNLNTESIGNIALPFPSKEAQSKIVSYLDEKTALLDETIAKKQKQIDLLSEHRTALINNAITKGLDPNAEMRDSRVEWVGMIPKGWEVKKLKYVASNKNQKTPFSSDMFSVALENVESWTGKHLPTEGEKIFETDMNSFEEGDVLFGKLRPYLAKAYKAESDGLCVGEFLVLRPSNEITQDFLFYRTISSDFITQVNNSTFGAKMPRADWGFIGNLAIGIPSIEEQEKIVDFLKKETAYIEAMKEKIEQSVELLQEYKTSLISHAVSGKIKVS